MQGVTLPASVITTASIDDFKARLSGFVLLPGDDGYEAAITIDNGRIKARPAMIVMVNSFEDVARSLRYARANELRLTVRGGGHSASGYSLNSGGMVIDLSLMNDISLDRKARTVRVQMGARWNDVYLYLIANGDGLIPIGGGCPTVGIPGFMLGGGYSFVSRSYGMSIDNLLEITVVTADGEIHRSSASSTDETERDLFWACRGGGGGNFGVAVEMVIHVHQPRTKNMFMAQLRYDPTAACDVLPFYNEWVETVPDELAAYGIWGYFPDPANYSSIPRKIEQFGFTVVYNGNVADGVDLVAPLLKRNPISAQLNALTLPEFEEINGRSTLVDNRQAYIRSGMIAPRGLTKDVASIMSAYMASTPSKSSFMVWTHGGGAIERVAPDATGFYHRHARFVPELKSIWESPQQARANIEWAWAFFNDLAPHLAGAYLNYIDPLLPQWQQMYYGTNYSRLLEIKRRVDPDGIFDFQQGVGSTFEPSTSQPLDLSPLNRTFAD